MYFGVSKVHLHAIAHVMNYVSIMRRQSIQSMGPSDTFKSYFNSHKPENPSNFNPCNVRMFKI